MVRYYEHVFPLDPGTYPSVFEGMTELPEDEHTLEFDSVITAFGNLPGREETGEERLAERVRDAAVNRGRLARLCEESPAVARAVEGCVRRVNGDPAEPESFDTLHRILEEQAYRLVYWRVASDEINYRRFFSINDLAGIRVEDERVFDETHRLILRLVGEGKVSGLRIDHIDGLYNPAGYLEKLQEETARARGEDEDIYVVVEKILAPHEHLPEGWPVAGTTGYDFLNQVGELFVNPDGEGGMDRAYRRFLGREVDFEEILVGCKRLIMRVSLASELNVLARRLLRISGYGRRSYDFTINVLRGALSEVVAHFPVYRTYVTAAGPSEEDRRYVEWAVARAKKRSTAADTTVYDFIRSVLLLEVQGPAEYREMALGFVMKFQQYTGPVMAKGMEDTALYVYDRLVSLNEVGGEPDRFGVSVSAFHHLNAERARRWPNAMLATATHDTKRGEDARARISVLSEIPNEWRERLARWGRINRSRRREVDGTAAPSRNDEYLLYQTLLGTWPNGEVDEEYGRRIREYMQKAMREAQVYTSWLNVNEDYERAVFDFVDVLLSPENSLFLEEFVPFARRVSRLGALNSLSQTLLKLTSPGVPDIYQGCELWDLSLVDPDNRRPVDYALREHALAELKKRAPEEASSLLEDGRWETGAPKLYLIWRALGLRRGRPDLFERGGYVPLEVEGERADRLVAFARTDGEDAALTIAPRLCARLDRLSGSLLPRPEEWSGTRVLLPEELSGLAWRDALSGGRFGSGSLSVQDLFASFPAALLVPG
jgi:(1->4)-alpha-D-glucan 1-alpha-D-glucosylmutase